MYLSLKTLAQGCSESSRLAQCLSRSFIDKLNCIPIDLTFEQFEEQVGRIDRGEPVEVTNPKAILRDSMVSFVDDLLWSSPKSAQHLREMGVSKEHVWAEPKDDDDLAVYLHFQLVKRTLSHLKKTQCPSGTSKACIDVPRF